MIPGTPTRAAIVATAIVAVAVVLKLRTAPVLETCDGCDDADPDPECARGDCICNGDGCTSISETAPVLNGRDQDGDADLECDPRLFVRMATESTVDLAVATHVRQENMPIQYSSTAVRFRHVLRWTTATVMMTW
ncbi:hypothetical protein NL676_033986 [Syzygium grande]|nr:hypothetical protein NL676_033986 [Syzygium grande]